MGRFLPGDIRTAEIVVKRVRCTYGRCSVHKGKEVPTPASNDTMGRDRGTRLSILWIHLNRCSLAPAPPETPRLRLVEAIGHAAAWPVR